MHKFCGTQSDRLPPRQAWRVINQTIDGYRLVRTVAESTRACTLLAQPAVQAAVMAEPVLLTVYRSSVSPSSVHAEWDAMSRVSSEHLTAVWDIASASDGSMVLVSEWIPGVSLSRLLRTRAYLTAGEAITILVPLIETLAKLHEHGVVHGGLSLDTIVFRETGSPVITGFSDAPPYEPKRSPAVLSQDAAVRVDIAALLRIATGVLSAVRTDGLESSRLSDCERWVLTADVSSAPNWATEFEQRIFSLGAPEPVRLMETDLAEVAGDPLRALVFNERENSVQESPAKVRDRVSVVGLPAWIHDEFDRGIAVLRSHMVRARDGLRRWLAPVRLRVWILGGIAIVTVIAAIVPTVSARPTSKTMTVIPSSSSTLEPIHATTDADPSAALNELLSAREFCFRDLSVECLSQVETADSPAFAADSNEIRRVIEGGELSPGVLFVVDQVVGSQELGDSVVFSIDTDVNDKPASVLLVKGEAGWRIRSYSLPN